MTTDLELIPVDDVEADNVALIVAKSSAYLPRIKLCQGSAKEVNSRQVARGGNYALVKSKEDVEDLGDEVPMLICAGRAKALRTGDMILSFFDPSDEEFKKIEEESKVKDSGCMYGPEYLVWLPDQECFATLFLNSPTARRESGAVHARLRKAALLTSHLIVKPKFSWFGPVCKDCSTPFDIPDLTVVQEQINKFRNERSSAVKVEDSTEDTRER